MSLTVNTSSQKPIDAVILYNLSSLGPNQTPTTPQQIDSIRSLLEQWKKDQVHFKEQVLHFDENKGADACDKNNDLERVSNPQQRRVFLVCDMGSQGLNQTPLAREKIASLYRFMKQRENDQNKGADACDKNNELERVSNLPSASAVYNQALENSEIFASCSISINNLMSQIKKLRRKQSYLENRFVTFDKLSQKDHKQICDHLVEKCRGLLGYQKIVEPLENEISKNAELSQKLRKTEAKLLGNCENKPHLSIKTTNSILTGYVFADIAYRFIQRQFEFLHSGVSVFLATGLGVLGGKLAHQSAFSIFNSHITSIALTAYLMLNFERENKVIQTPSELKGSK